MLVEQSKTVLVFPGSNLQIAFVKKIREMGHSVLVVNPLYAIVFVILFCSSDSDPKKEVECL